MTMHTICGDPIVNSVAWSVLKGIIPNGISPHDTGEWLMDAREGAGGYNVETIDGRTGFGEDAKGLGWHQSNGRGTVWLLVPEFKDLKPNAGWTGPPQVILDGDATITDAYVILRGMALQLGIEP